MLELNNYQTSRIRKKKFLITTILVLVGMLILYFGAVLKYKEYFGEGLGISFYIYIIIFFDKITGLKEKKSNSFKGDEDGNK